MEKLILKSLVLVAALSLAACAQKEEEVKGVDAYVTINDNFTQKDTDGLDGSGAVRFSNTLPGITSNQSIEIKGSLRPGGSVSVVMNSDDLALSDSKGVIFQLIRSSTTTDTRPSARILVQGVAVNVAATRLAYYNAQDFNVIIEVHNTPTSTRVLVWRKDYINFSLANVDVDTATASHLSSTFPGGSGQGIFAGLKLVNSKLTAAQIGDAKVTLP